MSIVAEKIKWAVTPQVLFARAEALVPILLERAVRTDAERAIPLETVAELRDEGLFRMQQSVEYGGFGMSALDRMHISRTLARGCVLLKSKFVSLF